MTRRDDEAIGAETWAEKWRGEQPTTRAELARKIVCNAREYLFDLVPNAEVVIAVDDSPAIAAAGIGARQTFRLTVTVGDPDGAVGE